MMYTPQYPLYLKRMARRNRIRFWFRAVSFSALVLISLGGAFSYWWM